MHVKTIHIVFRIGFLILVHLSLRAQVPEQKKSVWKNMQLNGYVKNLTSVIVPPNSSSSLTNEWMSDNLLHQRFNYWWFINNNLKLEAAMRNRLYFGEAQKLKYTFLPGYLESMESDPSWLDLTSVVASDTSYLLHTTFDRLNFQGTFGKIEIRLGRQRINWGTSLVWNPNDIFNAYSLFDFDYEERPGTDAGAIKYYLNSSANVEAVYAPSDSLKGSSTAIKYQFNKAGYDWQGFAGFQKGFWVAGGGWAGEIKGAGFRGEFTQFVPAFDYIPFESQLVATVDFDYTFNNSLRLSGSYLYNSEGLDTKEGNYGAFFVNRQLSAQLLSPSMHSIYAGAGYQFAPMFYGNFFTILNPSDLSFFLGPAASYTVSNNFEVMLTAQFFSGTPNTAYGDYGSQYYLRFKWNF
ncbi:MAG: hypothetical protein KDC83_02165 [Flavobacteriales bacterium]|nr:hypothetical protein [Flavobacteriales bacterium]